MKTYIIGVDIGGTNTDGVVADALGHIVSSQKVTTTYPVDLGFSDLLAKLLLEIDPSSISRICVGTTHAMNALLTQDRLDKVGLIRIVAQPPLIDPASDWPDSLRKSILAATVCVRGGFECDGRASSHFDRTEVEDGIAKLLKNGAQSIAVVGTFAPLYGEQEYIVRAMAARAGIPVTVSCELGGIGFVERENAALVNAALSSSVKNGFDRLKSIAKAQGLSCPLYLTQNNGSLLSVDEALRFPIKTIAAGPSNSCVGAAKLSGFSDSIVIDIGGTSTDLGVVNSGFIKRSFANANIGGIALNFAMPDVLSVGIGGGSLIHAQDGNMRIGPQSLGARTLEQSQAFGGDQLSLTDISISLSLANIPGADASRIQLNKPACIQVANLVQAKVSQLVDRIRGPNKDLPVIAVGGGSQLGFLRDVIVPQHAGVANAYGAALAQKSATIDKTVSLVNRERVLDDIESEVISAAVDAGAIKGATKVVYKDVIPYSYIAGNQARVIMTAAGPLA